MSQLRVVVGGGPRTGKTTLAERYDDARHTDDLIESCSWSEASELAATWLDEPGPWLVEGVATVRALRKWLANNDEGKPCDLVVWLREAWVDTSAGQDTMAKGCETIWAEIEPELSSRGVEIAYGVSSVLPGFLTD